MMDINDNKKKTIAKWIIGIVTACIIIFLGVQNIKPVIKVIGNIVSLGMPLIVGLIVAAIINVPMKTIESHLWTKTKKDSLKKLRRPISMLLSILLIVGVLAGVIWLVIPELIAAIRVIAQNIISYISKLSSMSDTELAALPFGNVLLSIEWDKILNTLQNLLKSNGSDIINTAMGAIGSAFGAVVDFFISFIFAIYILSSKEKLKAQCKRLIRAWIPQSFGEWAIHAASTADSIFRSFVTGQTLEAVILGTLCMIGMWILRIPYAPMVGALVGVTALIPVVGAFIGAIVGAFMILTQAPFKAFIFLIFLVVLQQLEGNIIYPKVMGSRVNLPAMWILASVTVGGSVAGPVGMLLSVPTASTLYILLREATEKREKKLALKNNCNQGEKENAKNNA